MILKEIALTTDRPASALGRAAELESRVICSLLMRSLRKRIKAPFQKISIRIGENADSLDGSIQSTVLLLRQPMAMAEFAETSGIARGEFLLKFVIGALAVIFREHRLDESALQEAEQFVVEQRFRNRIAGKVQREPGGERRAYVEVEQSMNEASVWLIVEAGSVSMPFLIATDLPDEFVFQRYFGPITWNGNILRLEVGGSPDLTVELRPTMH